jgi:hypothetical protein
MCPYGANLHDSNYRLPRFGVDATGMQGAGRKTMQRLMCLFLVAAGLWSCDQNTQPTASRLDGPKLVYTVDAVILERPDDSGAIVLRA